MNGGLHSHEVLRGLTGDAAALNQTVPEVVTALSASVALPTLRAHLVRLVMTLRFAAVMLQPPRSLPQIVKAIGLGLEHGAKSNDALQPIAAAFHMVVLQHLDVNTCAEYASTVMEEPAVGDAVKRRNRRLATLSRTTLVFAPPVPASVAVTQQSVPLPSGRSDALLINRAIHPLRMVHEAVEWLSRGTTTTGSENAGPVLIIALQERLGTVLVRGLVAQCFSHRFALLQRQIAASTTGAGGPRGTGRSREGATLATQRLQTELQVLCRAVQTSLVSLREAWGILLAGGFPHSDFSLPWFDAVSQYTRDLHAWSQAARTDVILDPRSLTRETLGSSQIVGNNFALLVFPRPSPSWGMAFAVGGSVVPKVTAVHVACTLLAIGATSQAHALLSDLRRGGVLPAAPPSTDLLPAVNLSVAPNSACPAGSLGSTICDVVLQTFAAPDGMPRTEAAKLWAHYEPLLTEWRSAWSSIAPLTTVATFFVHWLQHSAPSTAMPPSEDLAAAERFLSDIALPSLVGLPPSPALSAVLARLLRQLPFDIQRRVVLGAEQDSSSSSNGGELRSSVAESPTESVEALRHRTLLSHCLNRVSSGDPRTFSGLLAPVFYALPFTFISRLLTKAVGYSDTTLLATNAQLVRDAPALFFAALPIIALERIHEAAEQEALPRVTALSNFLAVQLRHNSSSVDWRYLTAYVNRCLASKSRAGVVVGISVLSAVLQHALHVTMESHQHRTVAQLDALCGGPVAVWYAGGSAESFIPRWTRGVWTPRMMRRCERTLAEALGKPPTNDRRTDAPSVLITLLQSLLALHATVIDLYADLPGRMEDVLRLSLVDTDAAGDLAAAVLRIAASYSATSGKLKGSSFSFDTLRRTATIGNAILYSQERRSLREDFLRHGERQASANSADEDDVATTTMTTRKSRASDDETIVGAAERWSSGLANEFGHFDAPDRSVHLLLACVWGLDMSDLASDATIDSTYDAAAGMVQRFVETSDANVRAAQADRRADPAAALAGYASGRREYEDEGAALADERASVPPMRTSAQAVIDATVQQFEATDLTLPEPHLVAQNIVLQRVRLSAASALFTIRLLERLADRALLATTKPSTVQLIHRWVSHVLMAFIAATCVSFVGLTDGEAHRVGLALAASLRLLERLGFGEAAESRNTGVDGEDANQVNTANAPRSIQSARMQAVISRALCEILCTEAVSAAVQRNAFVVLERLRGVYPTHAPAARLVEALAALHAKPSSPHFASASSLAHAAGGRATDLERKVSASTVVGQVLGQEMRAYVTTELAESRYLSDLLQPCFDMVKAAVERGADEPPQALIPEASVAEDEEQPDHDASGCDEEHVIVEDAVDGDDEFVGVVLGGPLATTDAPVAVENEEHEDEEGPKENEAQEDLEAEPPGRPRPLDDASSTDNDEEADGAATMPPAAKRHRSERPTTESAGEEERPSDSAALADFEG